MAFKMRSGNKVSFKNMGSSPAKDMKTGSYEHSFESTAKQGVSTPETEKERLKRVRKEKMENEPRQGVDTTPRTYGPKKKSPAKQMTDFSNVTVNGEDAETVKKRNR